MNRKEYSFIIEFDEVTDKQMRKLTDCFNSVEIKFRVLKSNYNLKKQEKLENALDEIEIKLQNETILVENEIDRLMNIIKKAKGE